MNFVFIFALVPGKEEGTEPCRANISSSHSPLPQLSQVRSISPSGQGVPCRFFPCTARAGLCLAINQVGGGGCTGSQSGSATPDLTQVPSTHSRGLLNCRK